MRIYQIILSNIRVNLNYNLGPHQKHKWEFGLDMIKIAPIDKQIKNIFFGKHLFLQHFANPTFHVRCRCLRLPEIKFAIPRKCFWANLHLNQYATFSFHSPNVKSKLVEDHYQSTYFICICLCISGNISYNGTLLIINSRTDKINILINHLLKNLSVEISAEVQHIANPSTGLM